MRKKIIKFSLVCLVLLVSSYVNANTYFSCQDEIGNGVELAKNEQGGFDYVEYNRGTPFFKVDNLDCEFREGAIGIFDCKGDLNPFIPYLRSYLLQESSINGERFFYQFQAYNGYSFRNVQYGSQHFEINQSYCIE